jgi:hypothetical protein
MIFRLAAYLFALDCHFVIFYRSPPRLTVREMTGDLPCPEEAFKKQEHYHRLAPDVYGRNMRLPSLSSLIETLMSEEWDTTCDQVTNRLTVFHLFLAIGGRYYHLWHILRVANSFLKDCTRFYLQPISVS